ncbi:DUF547 domain-containing protein [Aurantibacter crassamenti]|uniref:DUF547 domain-containing protein n=1 Tax=Aurantibacter crassamenti TaxID=1837375 RepID=UPI001939323F|nr:DUF547 domain-containing protein [Aurantibacter crassamenti]MBM1104708.1 DUF547 domain-containing protein [Aurantibacter crassamenti]
MFKTLIFTALSTLIFCVQEYSSDIQSSFEPSQNEALYGTNDHTLWNSLLAKHVDAEGNVDYAGFVADKAKLETYLEQLNKNTPADNWTKNEKLAYYINLYNAATVKLILDNYPLKSIKDINSPWDKKWVLVGGKKQSLGNIEHKILRKMDEPRIHFAINCASYSCPKLVNKAFIAETMEKQLEAATLDFVNDASRNKISEDNVQLSNIFKWYKSDFTENGSLVDYLNKYSKTKAQENSKISYLNYDWGLNEAR